MTGPPANWPKATIPDILVTHKSNPVISMWDSDRVRRVLEQIPFYVSFAYTFDETNWYADLLLPENIDLEGTQLFPMGGLTFCYGIKWQHAGFHVRQPVVKPPFKTRDMTDIFTDLANRLGMLPQYYAMIGLYLQLKDEYALDPTRKYAVEEIYEQMARSVTDGQHGLAWFKEHGAIFFPLPKLEWYKYTQMQDLGLRYELPYQERVTRIGRQLGDRLHSKGIRWWDRALHEYQALPECEDFAKLYETKPEYDLTLMTSRSMQFYWGGNADVPWMIEAAGELIDHGGVVMNAQAAAARGIKHGDTVWVESPIGQVKARALLRQGIRPDSVLMMQPFGHDVTAIAKDTGWPNMNPITPMPHEMTDETGSGSDHVRVRVYKAGR
jgi:phenylacetyl-CoA:acceptor oxidoreductase